MNELIALFTTDQAARLTGISAQQITRWARRGFITPRYVDESGWLGVKRLFSFRDLVALRTLLILRDTYHLPDRELSRANEFLQRHYEDPWASLPFHVLGNELIFDEPTLQRRMAAARPGQLALPVDLEPIVQAMHAQVAQTVQRQPSEIGQIRRDRLIMGGRPVIAGTRIPTAAIWSFYSAGATNDEILAQYPDLQSADVEQAIAYERERYAKRARRRAARSA
jgi:uncharacterized protein (DUF433 family)